MRRDARELPPGADDPARPRPCDAVRTLSEADLRVAQGLPARPVREPHRARRGGADDGRAVVHDRSGRPAAARRHVGQRHHGRHVRRDRRARRAARARGHRPGPGGPERAVRELRLPLQPAHAAVLDDRRAAAADAVAGLGLERLRRVHAGARRAVVRRRGQRQAVRDPVPGAGASRPDGPAGLRHQRLAGRGAARVAAPARRDLPALPHRRTLGQARGGGAALRADRAPRAVAGRPAPACQRRSRDHADRRRRQHRRGAAAPC